MEPSNYGKCLSSFESIPSELLPIAMSKLKLCICLRVWGCGRREAKKGEDWLGGHRPRGLFYRRKLLFLTSLLL